MTGACALGIIWPRIHAIYLLLSSGFVFVAPTRFLKHFRENPSQEMIDYAQRNRAERAGWLADEFIAMILFGPMIVFGFTKLVDLAYAMNDGPFSAASLIPLISMAVTLGAALHWLWAISPRIEPSSEK